jgi:hypothetical protein
VWTRRYTAIDTATNTPATTTAIHTATGITQEASAVEDERLGERVVLDVVVVDVFFVLQNDYIPDITS